MSTANSIAAFQAYSFSDGGRRKRKKESKVFAVIHELGCRGTINQISLRYKSKYPDEARDVCSVIVQLYMQGRLSRDDNNPIIGETERLQSVYYIPDVPLTKEEVLRRQLEAAEVRLAEAHKKVAKLQEELLHNEFELTNFKLEHDQLMAAIDRGEQLNPASLKRLTQLKKTLETGWKPGSLKIRDEGNDAI